MDNGSDTGRPLRVVVVGAGVTGLAAAHAFESAGIAYVVVERQAEVAPPAGATIGLFPSTLRVLKQFGVLDLVEDGSDPFEDGFSNRDARGRVLSSPSWRQCLRDNLGHDFRVLERRAFLQILYDALPDKSKIRLGRTATKVQDGPDAVHVDLDDGSRETGDVVLGADGVRSFVRQAMWEEAHLEPGTVKDEAAITTTWRCLFGVGPGEPGRPNAISVSSFPGKRSVVVSHQPNLSSFTFFWKTERRPLAARTRYTADDAAEAAASIAHLPLDEKRTFADVWDRRQRAQLVDIQEGVLSRWHYGRYVLVGDAAHKVRD
ncbi:hypothetical protein CDD83_5125 [Cordyceps sp. RAO-2017]|nr:hypothetical protein CDD83_5125 [Cordyceps sp. RAO-2017]